MSEARRHRRYAVELAAEVAIGPEVLVASTENLSIGGVGLVLDRPLKEGAIVGVTLFLTQDGIEDPDLEPFEAKCKVMWAAERDSGEHVIGVQLGATTAKQREQLTRFLAELEAPPFGGRVS